MAYEVTVRKHEREHAAVIRFRCPRPEVGANLGSAYGEIGAYLGELGATGPGTHVYARFHAMEPDMDVEAGFTMTAPVAPRGRIKPGELPACEAAVTMHTGPYEGLPAAYQAIMAWLQANRRWPAGPAWEDYLSEPDSVPPAEWQTEVWWPIA